MPGLNLRLFSHSGRRISELLFDTSTTQASSAASLSQEAEPVESSNQSRYSHLQILDFSENMIKEGAVFSQKPLSVPILTA